MGTFIVFVLESAVCLALFYLIYKLLLSKDTFHRFNRVALLGMLLLSVAIPIGATMLSDTFIPLAKVEVELGGLQAMGITQDGTKSIAFPTALIPILALYAAGVLFFVGRLLRSWMMLARLLRNCTREKLGNGINLYAHRRNIAPFSWMHCIVVSSKDLAENKDIILTHELAHIRLGHSWDLLLADLCLLVQWFNPAAWLMRQELQAVHEYEADDKVLQHGIDARKYQLLIIEKAVGTRLYSMANSLNHGSLKKRITMMLKEKSNPWARAKYAVVLPLAAIALVGFAQPEFTTLRTSMVGEIDEMLSLAARSEKPEQPTAGKSNAFYANSEQTGEKNVGIPSATSMESAADTAVRETPPPPPPVLTTKKFDPPTEIKTKIVKQTKKFSPPVLVDKKIEVVKTKTQAATDPIEITPKEKKGEATDLIEITTKKKEAYLVPDVMPQYPGGEVALMEYLKNTAKYPASGVEKKVEGRVICSFIISETGKITDIKVLKGLGEDMDKEAIRVISGMPNWTPGKKNDKPCAVSYVLPLTFKLKQ